MFNSNYTSEQLESAIGKALADLKIEGATVNIQMVDENTPASGSVTKEDGSDRAKFDFKIPILGCVECTETSNNIVEGNIHIDSSKVFLISDGDVIYFDGNGRQNFCVAAISAIGDGGYTLIFDSEVSFGIGDDTQLFPAGKEINVPSYVGFGLKYIAINRRFFCQFNYVGTWHF